MGYWAIALIFIPSGIWLLWLLFEDIKKNGLSFKVSNLIGRKVYIFSSIYFLALIFAQIIMEGFEK